VLIDHLLVSRGITVTEGMVWNPFFAQETDEMTVKVKALKEELLGASDHFPVSAVLEF
jgi:hypothetical protein